MKPICINTANLDELEWTPHNTQGRVGASVHYLFQDKKSGQTVALVRFDPNSLAPPHEHTGHESIMVLAGQYEDDFGKHEIGDIVVYPPKSQHKWRSKMGALLYVVWGGSTTPVEAYNGD